MIRKTNFSEGCTWLKFNNLRLAVGMNLQFYINVVKGLKLNGRKFLGLFSTFVKVTGEKLVETGREGFLHTTPSPILDSVKRNLFSLGFKKNN